MKQIILHFFFITQLIGVPYYLEEVIPLYYDEEITQVWESLDDLYNPTQHDYLKIMDYLKWGKRPYLNPLFDHLYLYGKISKDAESLSATERATLHTYRILQNIQLIGAENERPIFEKFVMGGCSPLDKSRCVILYATYNKQNDYDETSYAQKLRFIIDDLKEEGYKGHVLSYIGGYPLLNAGGLRFAHIPYSFKILALIEASQLGYENVLWIDTSMHPSNDLSIVFQEIEQKGIYTLTNHTHCDYDYSIHLLSDPSISASDLELKDLSKIPHMVAGIIGLSFKFQVVHDFIDEWYRLTALVEPALTFYPEEFLLSVAKWKTFPYDIKSLYDVIYFRSVLNQKPHCATKPFWFDKQ